MSRVRRGFTLIELLVVIAIIAILIGLLVPAVQKVREAAARTQCVNNLKQWGLAMHSCHDNYKKLPPAVGFYPGTTSGNFGVGTFFLLPFMEQQPLFDSALGTTFFGQTNKYPGNNGVYAKVVPLFVCPSDPSTSDGTVNLGGTVWGACSYGFNSLAFTKSNGIAYSMTAPYYTASGSFDPQGAAKIPGSFPDGTSNTIMIAHRYAQCSNSLWPVGGSAWAYGALNITPSLPAPMNKQTTGFPVLPIYPGVAITYFAAAPGGIGLTSIGSASMFQVQPAPFVGNCDPLRAASPHTGVMPVCMADGSVRSLSGSMSGTTWWFALTPSGNEPPQPDWDV
jgi:prepilin-type N-terminal cleavage/methylation domain-containing protein